MNFKSCGHNRPSFRPECPLKCGEDLSFIIFTVFNDYILYILLGDNIVKFLYFNILNLNLFKFIYLHKAL